MKDFVVEDILRTHVVASPAEVAAGQAEQRARRGYLKPVIPPANRYPHSILRADLEYARQPWNRTMLGSSGYRTAA
jgi:hypothetical protein